MKKALLGLSLALMASTAYGADLGYVPKVPVGQQQVSFNWTGPSVWGSVGYIDSKASTLVDVPGSVLSLGHGKKQCGTWWPQYCLINTPTSASAALDQTIKGLALGGGVGYDWTLSPSVVAGLEGDLYWSSASDSQNIGIPQYNRKLTMLGFYGARVGFVVTPTTLIFAKAGGSIGSFSQSVTGGSYTSAVSDTLWGWAAGAGIQQLITRDGLFAKLEATYFGFRDQCFSGATLCAKDNVVMGMASIGKKF